MAHSRTAKKRIRQNIAARSLNRWRLVNLRNAMKEFNESMLHGSNEQAAESYKKVAQVLDRTASKGVIHKNQAARRKSRLSARLKAKKAG